LFTFTLNATAVCSCCSTLVTVTIAVLLPAAAVTFGIHCSYRAARWIPACLMLYAICSFFLPFWLTAFFVYVGAVYDLHCSAGYAVDYLPALFIASCRAFTATLLLRCLFDCSCGTCGYAVPHTWDAVLLPVDRCCPCHTCVALPALRTTVIAC